MYSPPTQETIAGGAKQICEAVSARPFFIGRNGTIETEVLHFWHMNRLGEFSQARYPSQLIEQIERNAGVFPNTRDSVDRWCVAYAKALALMDGGAAGWYEPTCAKELALLDVYAPTAFRTPLRSLEPYYMQAGQRWTERLQGRVCVVSSFAKTIEGQLRKDIWRGEQAGLLDISGVEWSFVRTGYSPSIAAGNAEWPAGCRTWEDAVAYVTKAVIATGANTALIGCGGLGMVIAGELRAAGVSCIVLGGAIQVLFGVKGRRWARHDVISRFWNDAWVSPAQEEVPKAAVIVEGGCYW